MLQEDSNGESSFEIIHKKNLEKEYVPSVPTTSISALTKPTSISAPTGNLLSNVQPPSSLPDFTLWSSPSNVGDTKTIPTSTTLELVQSSPSIITSSTSESIPASIENIVATGVVATQPLIVGNQFPTTEFSAAIPPSKGVLQGSKKTDIQTDTSSSNTFLNLFKDALSTKVLSKMAEKAKSSVDSIITTLDPQMSEYIYSGGDTEVTVTSEKEQEVSAIRDAFHTVFGQAWVNGIKLNMTPKNIQAFGFEQGLKNAEEKIEYSMKYRNTPTVAVENILFKQNDSLFDLALLILKDRERQITIKTFSQPTSVPVDEFLKRIEKERPDLSHLDTDDALANYLVTIPNWQAEVSGLSRKEVLLLAAKSLVKMYKNKLASL